MTKRSFFVGHDLTGKQYVYQVGSEVDKNHSIADAPFDTTGEGRIYETKSERCPVASFIKYLEHLHPIQTLLWQLPRETAKISDLNQMVLLLAIGRKNSRSNDPEILAKVWFIAKI